jgi:hypothetical protein
VDIQQAPWESSFAEVQGALESASNKKNWMSPRKNSKPKLHSKYDVQWRDREDKLHSNYDVQWRERERERENKLHSNCDFQKKDREQVAFKM